MKKIVILFFILNSIFITYAANISDFFGGNGYDINIYNKLEKYYSKQFSEIIDKSIQNTAKQFNTTEDIIKKILNGNLLYCQSIPKYKKITKWSLDNFTKCFNDINGYYQTQENTNSKTKYIQDVGKLTNLYANGSLKDSSYDIQADAEKIAKLLFGKTKQNNLKTWGKIAMKNKSAKDLMGINENDILQPFNPIVNKDSLNNLFNPTSTEEQVINIPIDNNQINITNTQDNNNNNTGNTNSPKKDFKNPDFQIGNICQNNNLDKQIQTKENKPRDYMRITNPSQDSPLGNNAPGFDVFGGGSGVNASFINNNDFDFMFGSGSGSGNNNTNNLSDKEKLANGQQVCSAGSDKILAVCIQLIKSGPRGPVGGTTKVSSIKEVIDKISDDLKDIKQSFITPAGHGDEALDIDFEHIKLAGIMSFNIILTKKPVFKYSKSPNKKTDKQINKVKDTECEGLSRNLANIYSMIGIANCFSTEEDKNKYLLSNNKKSISVDVVDGNKNIEVGSKDILEAYKNLVGNIIGKGFANLDDLLTEWRSASATIKAKSE